METNRRSIRLPQYDYSQPRMYFITILTHKREESLCTFSGVPGILLPWGKIVQEEWNRLPIRFNNIELDEFVIMPDHIHGLISVKELGTAAPQFISIEGKDRRALTKTEGFGEPIRDLFQP